MKDNSAARKYATAFFEQALAKNELRACQQGLEEIARVARLRESLGRVLGHPFIAIDEKKKIMKTALGEYSTPALERFLSLLIEKKRFGIIQGIAAAFQDLVDRHQNIQPVRIKTALPMTDVQQQTLEKKLSAWLKSSVRMDVVVDPQLIGGIIIQTRDRESDQSVRGELRQMLQQLSKN